MAGALATQAVKDGRADQALSLCDEVWSAGVVAHRAAHRSSGAGTRAGSGSGAAAASAAASAAALKEVAETLSICLLRGRSAGPGAGDDGARGGGGGMESGSATPGGKGVGGGDGTPPTATPLGQTPATFNSWNSAMAPVGSVGSSGHADGGLATLGPHHAQSNGTSLPPPPFLAAHALTLLQRSVTICEPAALR